MGDADNSAQDGPPRIGWLTCGLPQVPAGDDWLTPPEKDALRHVSPTRRRDEWRLGRWTAKQALTAWLGSHGRPAAVADIGVLPPADTGSPRLYGVAEPHPSVALSDRSELALCAVAPQGSTLGCAVEAIEPRSMGFADEWFTPAEQELVAHGEDAGARDLAVALLWTAKESAVGALASELRVPTRTLDVVVPALVVPDDRALTAAGTWGPLEVHGAAGRHLSGWWRQQAGRVLVLLHGHDEVAFAAEEPVWLGR